MKFKNFEALYGAACEILAAAGKNPVVEAAVKTQKKVLLKQFAANFPSSYDEADSHPGFNPQQFIDMLIKFPEVLEGHGEKLAALLEDLEKNRFEVPEELKQICEGMKVPPKTMSPEEKAIAEALASEFPDSAEKLSRLPFTQDAVIAFLIAYPERSYGKRREFMDLLSDLCRQGFELPEPLARQWRGMVMEP